MPNRIRAAHVETQPSTVDEVLQLPQPQPPGPRVGATCEAHPVCLNSPFASGAPPTDLRCMIGDVGYYRARADDFLKRHPHEQAPAYYLEYGEKYAQRFTRETFEKLSPRGQAWLKDTFVALQTAIEDKRRNSPEAFERLERDEEKFKAFAYATHAKAYLEAGLSELSAQELVDVGLTPDVLDLANFEGVNQMFEVGLPILEAKLKARDTALLLELNEAMRRSLVREVAR